MLPATIGPYARQLATTWNELSGRQLLAVAQVIGQTYERPAARLDALLQVPRRTFRQLSVVQRMEMHHLVAFLHAPAAHAPLTAPLLPCVKLPHRRWVEPPRCYYGPREALRNLRFDEFIFADPTTCATPRAVARPT